MLRILHTNDLHSQLDQWPAVAAWIKQNREQSISLGEDVLLFDIGDHADRVHPITEGLQGKGNVSLLNMLNYDGATIGNNEGMTFSKKDLNTLYDQANFPIILNNLYDNNGDRPHWVKPYRIITTACGIRVGITGVTVPYYLFYKTLGWEIKDPFESLEEVVNILQKDVDLLICLSHLGLSEDERMAERFPEVDIILGAHTHQVLLKGKKINDTWINQAGRSGKYAGNIAIPFEKIGDFWKKGAPQVQSVLIDSNEQDPLVVSKVAELSEKADNVLNKEITFLREHSKVSWYESTPLIRSLAEGLREWCDAEISMVNAGVLLEDLPKGVITYKDLHRICPHPINPATIMISGEKILEIIRQGQKREMVEFRLKGLGFRGEILGLLVFDGLTVDTPNRYIQDTNVLVQGQPLNKTRIYKLATVDMFTFGNLYPAITSIAEKNYFMPEFLRDILAWKLQQSK